MKCEKCKKAEAVEVLRGEREDEELYVCKACAKAARDGKQRQRQRTRKVIGLPPGMSMSITEISPGNGEESSEQAQRLLGALMDSFKGLVDDIGKNLPKEETAKSSKEMKQLNPVTVPEDLRVKGCIHLEGLHLIGELEAVRRAFHALGLDLVGLSKDGVKDSGHVYRIMYPRGCKAAVRAVADIVREERNARERLNTEQSRNFSDALCRALAILKNCRMLSKGEFFDLLSPMLLAAQAGMLEGISLREIVNMMEGIDFEPQDFQPCAEELDRLDAKFADDMNRRFEEVMINDVY